MSDTKLRPEDLREKARTLIESVNNDTDGREEIVAWIEAVTDALAPAPSEEAKVECPNCGKEVGPGWDHEATPQRFTCQPAQPEPAAPEMPPALELVDEALRAANARGASTTLRSWWRTHAQPVAVGIERAREIAAQCWCDPETEMIEMDGRLAEAFAKRLVRQQAAQPVRLEKARKFLEWQWGVRFGTDESTGMIAKEIRAALDEIDAAEGKGEGRG